MTNFNDWKQKLEAVRALNNNEWYRNQQPPQHAEVITLIDVIYDAEWGQQENCHGRVFVTKQWTDWGDGRVRTLYVDRRRVACLYYQAYKSGGGHHIRMKLIDPQKAEADYRFSKKLGKEAAKTYHQARKALIKDLLASCHSQAESFEQWEYEDGQRGGTFYHPDHGCIGARGALQGAWGKDWATLPRNENAVTTLMQEGEAYREHMERQRRW